MPHSRLACQHLPTLEAETLQSLQGSSGMGTARRELATSPCVAVALGAGTGCGCTHSPIPVLETLLVQPKGFGFSNCSPSCRFEPKQGCSFLDRRRMPKQHSRAKGRRRTNRFILALVGRSSKKATESFKLDWKKT